MRHRRAELHSDIRRSLQKFETLTKALSKIKGAPKVVSLADAEIVEAKSTSLPKIHSAQAQASKHTQETTNDNPGPINQLTLLDHLLQLPAEQLRKSSHRHATVSHIDLSQSVMQPQGGSSSGVSLFTSAAAVGGQAAESLLMPRQEITSGGTPRHVQVTFERARANPPRTKARFAELQSLTSTVSPRTRAIKAAANAADSSSVSMVSKSSGGFPNHGAIDDDNRNSRGIAQSTKAAYGSVRFRTKDKLVQKPAGVVKVEENPLSSQMNLRFS